MRLFIPALTALTLAGCASTYDDQHREAAELRDALGWGAPRETFEPQELTVGGGAEPLDGALTRERVTREVVRRNPNVVAALERWVAFLERAPQRRALPDPMLRYGYESGDLRTHRVGLTQNVPFPAKLLADGRVALAEARSMRAQLHERTNRLREQAATTLATLHVWRRHVEIVDENLALMDRFIEIARTRYAAGTASRSDVLRAQVEREGLRVERAQFVHDMEAAESALNVLLDRRPDAPLGRVVPDPEPAAPEPLAVLFDRALHLRPELDVYRSRREAEHERLARAEYEWVPDFMLGANYVRESGQDEVELMGGISLPIWWGRIRAGVREAEANVRRADAETRDARNRVLDEVRASASHLIATTEQHRILRDDAIPLARQNIDVAEAGYMSGQLDFLALIDAQRMLLMQQLELERTRGVRSMAEAELQRAVGEPALPSGGAR